jgi:RNase P subunit RPR2
MSTKFKEIYCVKSKKFTDNKGKINHHKSSNGRKYITAKCKICGTTKSQFIGS